MDAVDRADSDARLVDHVDAWFGDDIRHPALLLVLSQRARSRWWTVILATAAGRLSTSDECDVRSHATLEMPGQVAEHLQGRRRRHVIDHARHTTRRKHDAQTADVRADARLWSGREG